VVRSPGLLVNDIRHFFRPLRFSGSWS